MTTTDNLKEEETKEIILEISFKKEKVIEDNFFVNPLAAKAYFDFLINEYVDHLAHYDIESAIVVKKLLSKLIYIARKNKVKLGDIEEKIHLK